MRKSAAVNHSNAQASPKNKKQVFKDIRRRLVLMPATPLKLRNISFAGPQHRKGFSTEVDDAGRGQSAWSAARNRSAK
jgi:hypothetical protein